MHAYGIPESPDALTPAWITDRLRAAGAISEGEVASFSVTRFGEGIGLLGQLVKVNLKYSGVANDAPENLVVKFPALSPENVALCEAIRLYWREHHFYTHSSRETPLCVPRVFHSALEGLTKFVLVLEEVRGARAGDQIQGAEPEQVRVAAREIARHHAKFWGKAKQGTQSWLPALADSDISQVTQALTGAGLPKVLAELSECFTEETKAVALKLVERMPELTQLICSGTTTFVHGDFRVDNLLFGVEEGAPPLTVLDWQICYEACGPYDVAYLMTQSVAKEVRREIEAEVIELYHASLVEAGVRNYTLADCREDYRRAATFCVCYPLIVAGSLDLANERGRALGKMMLDRALSAAHDVDSLALLESLTPSG